MDRLEFIQQLILAKVRHSGLLGMTAKALIAECVKIADELASLPEPALPKGQTRN